MRISAPLIEASAGGDRREPGLDRYGLAPMVLRRKVIALAASKGYAMNAGPEAEFFLF